MAWKLHAIAQTQLQKHVASMASGARYLIFTQAAEHGASRDRRLAENAEARAAEAAEEAALARQQAEDGAAQCINQIVATRLRHGSIVTSTPSTRRQLDGVAVAIPTARLGQRGRVFAEKILGEELSCARRTG